MTLSPSPAPSASTFPDPSQRTNKIIGRLRDLSEARTLVIKRSDLKLLCSDTINELKRLKAHEPVTREERHTESSTLTEEMVSGSVMVDWERWTISYHNTTTRLDRQTITLLYVFANAGGRICTHETLSNAVWPVERPQSHGDMLKVLISKLRKKTPWTIKAEWGEGYIMKGYTGNTPPEELSQFRRLD